MSVMAGAEAEEVAEFIMAAAAIGGWPSGISLRCRLERGGWRFAEPHEIAAPITPPRGG